jgi:hypothetical protein
MQHFCKSIAALLLLSNLPLTAQQTLPILVDGKPLLEYQAEPIAMPIGSISRTQSTTKTTAYSSTMER